MNDKKYPQEVKNLFLQIQTLEEMILNADPEISGKVFAYYNKEKFNIERTLSKYGVSYGEVAKELTSTR